MQLVVAVLTLPHRDITMQSVVAKQAAITLQLKIYRGKNINKLKIIHTITGAHLHTFRTKHEKGGPRTYVRNKYVGDAVQVATETDKSEY